MATQTRTDPSTSAEVTSAARARTRDALLDAAADTFARLGFHGASVDAIARAAGLTKGAVYSNFRSKEELFLALLDRNVDEIVGLLEGLLEMGVDQRLEQLPNRLRQATVLGEQWTLLELEFVLYAARNPQLRELVAERRGRTRAALAAVIERHLTDLGVADRADAAAELATMFTAGADGLAFAALTEPDLPVADRLATLVEALTVQVTRTAG